MTDMTDIVVFDPAQHSAARCQAMLSQLVAPRPIAMISTADADGVPNIAPFSYYMPVTGHPMLVAVTMGLRESDGGLKHSYENAMRSGDFVINVTTERFRDDIETAAIEFPRGTSELDALPWTVRPSVRVSSPSIVEAPARLECRVHRVVDLGQPREECSEVHVVFGEVVCATLDDWICDNDLRVDVAALRLVGRMGFPWFTTATPDSMFALPRVPYGEFARRDGRAH
jgi:flavin reductase (DIM6/NTAB) family NADH-FMN oxidoreductase RutF